MKYVQKTLPIEIQWRRNENLIMRWIAINAQYDISFTAEDNDNTKKERKTKIYLYMRQKREGENTKVEMFGVENANNGE